MDRNQVFARFDELLADKSGAVAKQRIRAEQQLAAQTAIEAFFAKEEELMSRASAAHGAMLAIKESGKSSYMTLYDAPENPFGLKTICIGIEAETNKQSDEVVGYAVCYYAVSDSADYLLGKTPSFRHDLDSYWRDDHRPAQPGDEAKLAPHLKEQAAFEQALSEIEQALAANP